MRDGTLRVLDVANPDVREAIVEAEEAGPLYASDGADTTKVEWSPSFAPWPTLRVGIPDAQFPANLSSVS